MSGEPEPVSVRAPVDWADFAVRCPACGHLNTTGEDWQGVALADGTWSPADGHRFITCEGVGSDGDFCELLLELPDVTLTLTYAGDR